MPKHTTRVYVQNEHHVGFMTRKCNVVYSGNIARCSNLARTVLCVREREVYHYPTSTLVQQA